MSSVFLQKKTIKTSKKYCYTLRVWYLEHMKVNGLQPITATTTTKVVVTYEARLIKPFNGHEIGTTLFKRDYPFEFKRDVFAYYPWKGAAKREECPVENIKIFKIQRTYIEEVTEQTDADLE